MTTILERQAIPQPEPVELVDFTELYGKAAKLLHYRPRFPGQSAADAIRVILRQLNIQPFDPASVERYKQQQVNKMRRLIGLAAWMYAIACLCCVVPMIVGLVSSNAAFFYCGLIFLLTSSLVFAAFHVRWASRPQWAWHRILLSEYILPVPEFALETAVAIKEAFNRSDTNINWSATCDFYIDELSQERRVIDPFLILSVSGEIFYLEVWNEPSFRAARTI